MIYILGVRIFGS